MKAEISSSKTYAYMEKIFLSFLFLFGLMFGSFASVIIYRLRSGESGIWTWRSHCKSCERNLWVLDLIPVLSWIVSKWICRKCSQKISAIYPILEIVMGLLFLGVWIFLIDFQSIMRWDGSEIIKLFFWLSVMFLSVIYVFYDILFLEIPESVLVIFNGIILWGLILSSMSPEWNLFPNFEIAQNIAIFWSLSIALIVFAWLYAIMLLELKEIYDVVIIVWLWVFLYFTLTFLEIPVQENPLLSGTLAAFALFVFFFLQILVSKGAWMWGGDLRIALWMGMLLGISYIFAGGMLAYCIGSIIGIGLVISQKMKTHKDVNFSMQVPFGPFLAAWYIGVLFFFPFWENIIQVYIL